MTIKFKRVTPRLWRGNGMGYSAASYAVERDGRKVGLIDSIGAGYGWTFHPLETTTKARIRRDTLKELKAVVLRRFEDDRMEHAAGL